MQSPTGEPEDEDNYLDETNSYETDDFRHELKYVIQQLFSHFVVLKYKPESNL